MELQNVAFLWTIFINVAFLRLLLLLLLILFMDDGSMKRSPFLFRKLNNPNQNFNLEKSAENSENRRQLVRES